MVTRKQKRKKVREGFPEDKAVKNHPVAKKSLGQNFLKDKKYLNIIVEASNLNDSDNVLEVGPGTGLLTDQILAKTTKLFCIEKDRRMVQYLLEKYNKQKKGPEIIEEDILTINLPAFLKERAVSDYSVVANIPYYITGKIIRLFLETDISPKSLVLLIQKEVAERICSEPGDMSILAISVQYFGDPEFVEIVPKDAFDPIPKVDSAVIRIIPGGNTEDKNQRTMFFRVVKSGFSSPRKKLLNNLATSLKMEKEFLQNCFRELKLDENIRAQNLSVDQWKILRDRLSVLLKK